jgi:hypothetical protein
MTATVWRLWLVITATLVPLGLLGDLVGRRKLLSDYFFKTQDLPVLALVMVLSALAFLLPRGGREERRDAEPGGVGEGQSAEWPPAPPRLRPVLAPALLSALALAVVLVGSLGAGAVFQHYPVSLDEFAARFGAAIHVNGAATAMIPEAWRPFGAALQPQFIHRDPTGAYWTSAYLPVNAAFQALGLAVGMAEVVSPLLAGVSVLAVYGIGRRLWPDRPSLALAAAVLLASSAQVLITAMTPYAMTAHLALNLVWLWLFLRGGAAGHAGAIGVGALACGLHEWVFHPLFAAPFIVQLWGERRRALASTYALAYGLILGFWVLVWPQGLNPVAGAPGGGAAAGALHLAVSLLERFDPAGAALMAQNLLRFALWQNPVLFPLALIGGAVALRTGGVMRSLALGILLTTLAMFVLLPYQGHGWGYRYLHGLIGSAALLAASAWKAALESLPRLGRQQAWRLFFASAAASFLVLGPWRAWQARCFAAPYAAAEAAIRASRADVVVLDDRGAWFTADLVRNDPYLRNRPKALWLGALSAPQVESLCRDNVIAVFDRFDAARWGILLTPAAALTPSDQLSKLRCGAAGAPVRHVSAPGS